MAKVKIVDIRDRPKLVGPGKREVDVEVLFETAKGYRGSVTLAKKELSEKKLQEAIKKEIEVQEKVLDTEIEV